MTISGVAQRDDLGSTWAECDAAVPNVSIVVGTTKVATVTCNDATGAFAATGVTIPSAGTVVAAYFDGATTKGIAYTRTANTTSNIASLVVMQNDVSMQSEVPADSYTDETFGSVWDVTDDADVPFNWTTWPANTPTGIGMHLRGDDTFNPANRGIATDSVDVMPGATMRGPTARAFQLMGSGTAGCEFETGVQMPLCIRPGGAYVGSATPR